MVELSDEAQQLLQRADEVLALLDSGEGPLHESLSSPLLNSEHDKTKSFRFPVPLVRAVENYAHDRRMHQKDVFSAALVEFLNRRGKEYVDNEIA